MRFRLSDQRSWSVEFEVNGPQELRRAVARAWDARIQCVRLDDHATDPAFALAARLREINEWMAVRRSRVGATADQIRAWEGQADAWTLRAHSMYGGAPGELAVHLWAAQSWRHISLSGRAVTLPRNVLPEVALSVWTAAEALAAHADRIQVACAAASEATTRGAAESAFDWLKSWDEP